MTSTPALRSTLALLLALSPGMGAGSQAADTVFHNAVVYTQDTEQPWAEALAVADGQVVAVGTNPEMLTLAGREAERIDLGGRFVMPGLHDAHIHLQMVAEFNANLAVDPELPWESIADAIRKRADKQPDNLWMLGGNLPWLTEIVGERADVLAHRSTLDALAPEHAVALWDVGGHAMLVSSTALRLAGIDRNTPDPKGGTIERDAQGEPTGILRELATNLILETAPPLTVNQYADGMQQAIRRLSSLGITSMQEAWANPLTVEALLKLEREERLNVRTSIAIAHPEEFTTAAAKETAAAALKEHAGYHGALITIPYTKFVLDGSAGGQTLVLVDPYEGTNFRGEFRNDPNAVMAEVARLHGLGIGSVLHAVGGGAIRLALDAVEAARAEHGANGVRHVIAHTVFVHPDDLKRFRELDVIAEFSPYFWSPNEGGDILRSQLGAVRLNWAFPVRTLLDLGVPGAAGSDWPVVFDPNPFPAIETLVTRERPGGSEENFAPASAISLAEALRLFTIGGATVMHQERRVGILAAGWAADFVVLDRNLFETPVREIHQSRAVRTVLAGRTVHRNEILRVVTD